jgi:hypothetical protein
MQLLSVETPATGKALQAAVIEIMKQSRDALRSSMARLAHGVKDMRHTFITTTSRRFYRS